MLMILEPISPILPEELTSVIKDHISNYSRALENDTLFNGLERSIRRQGEFWISQVKRDLTNAGRAIPGPILKDRMREASCALEHLHIFKLLVKMREEASLRKENFWKESFIF